MSILSNGKLIGELTSVYHQIIVVNTFLLSI